MTVNCCCRWGAAVSGEWPEFECAKCPVHQGEFALSHELCKRHVYRSLTGKPIVCMFCQSAKVIDLGPCAETELGVVHSFRCGECDGCWPQIPKVTDDP